MKVLLVERYSKLRFLIVFFSHELREVKVMELINLKHGDISVGEYALKFTKFSKYAPSLVVDPKAHINKIILGVSDLVVVEYKITMLVKEMDIC